MATNQCKHCLLECSNGEQHVCWSCFARVENGIGYVGVIHTKGACFLCQAQTGASLLCRGCFDSACCKYLFLDTRGPPVPFVPPTLNGSYGGLAKQVYAGIPAPPAPTPPVDPFDPYSFKWIGPSPTPPPPRPREKPICITCERVLSGHLDAYWGKDPRGSVTCAPCRECLGIS